MTSWIFPRRAESSPRSWAVLAPYIWLGVCLELLVWALVRIAGGIL